MNPVIESLLEIVEADQLSARHTSSHWQFYEGDVIVERLDDELFLRGKGFGWMYALSLKERILYQLQRLSYRRLTKPFSHYPAVWKMAKRLDRDRAIILLEIGCATGDFYRYLRIKYPRVSYYGVDISEPAIQRVREKFPHGRFFLTEPDMKLGTVGERIGL